MMRRAGATGGKRGSSSRGRTASAGAPTGAKAKAKAKAKDKDQGRGQGRRKLDLAAAARKMAAGATARNIARAAGSVAVGANLQRVGIRLRNELRSRLADAFEAAGYTVERFARDVVAATQAHSQRVVVARGEVIIDRAEVDHAARAAARGQYMDAMGIRRAPVEPAEAETPLAGLTDEQLAQLADAARELAGAGAAAGAGGAAAAQPAAMDPPA